jgi:hypothetical protein
MPGVAFPPVGPVGLSSPPSPVLCSAKTAPCSSQDTSLVARVPIPGLFLCVRGVPLGLVVGSKLPNHARAFDHPVPQSGNVTRRQVALPSSRATPMDACPALRPRWCPQYSPLRIQDCCLPVTGNRRLSPQYLLEGLLLSTTLRFSGLNHAACRLVSSSSVRPLLGVHVDVTPDLLARL